MLTKREKEVLQLVTSASSVHGKTPSYRMLMHLLGLQSPATIYKHIKNLKKKGYLNKSPDARYVHADETKSGQFALVGSISCGKKLTFFSQVASTALTFSEECYGFIVDDDSFCQEHIVQGDLLVVQVLTNTLSPKHGDRLLVTTKEGNVYIGILVTQDGEQFVSCQNTLFMPASELHSTGVVKAVIRNFSYPKFNE